MQSLVKTGESFEVLTRRVKERARREKLHRRIGALEARRKKVIEQKRFNWYERSFRILGTIRRLEAELRQPELFL